MRQTPNYRSRFDKLDGTSGLQIVVRNLDLQAQDKLYNRNKDGFYINCKGTNGNLETNSKQFEFL